MPAARQRSRLPAMAMDDYISKPIRAHGLLNLICKYGLSLRPGAAGEAALP
jgi:hypothetical protein